jgi:hypothetical protein
MGVNRMITIQAVFSEPIAESSISGCCEVSGSTGVTTSVSGSTLSIDPAGALDYETTYTVTISGEVEDLAGNAMGGQFSWSFTTESAPAPAFDFPLDPGRTWLYGVETREVGADPYIGFWSDSWVHQRVVAIEGQDPAAGKNASVFAIYDLGPSDYFEPPDACSSPDNWLNVSRFHVAQETSGLWRLTPSGWQQAVSYSGSVIAHPGNAFLMAGQFRISPRASTVQSVVQTTVPAGVFETVKTRSYYDDDCPGGFCPPKEYTASLNDYYANGQGIVRSEWFFELDDNDPQGLDLTKSGEAVLLSYAGPIFAFEQEPNDGPSAGSDQPLDVPFVAHSDIAISDPGSEADVYENVQGQRIVQDWYRIELPEGQDYAFALTTSHVMDGQAAGFPEDDLDLYLFRATTIATGTPPILEQVAASTRVPGCSEDFRYRHPSIGVSPVYFIAVQAWDTPSGRVPYSLAVWRNQ